MTRRIQPAPVHKIVDVPAPPATAFAIFTAGLDRWWPRTHTIGKSALRTAVLEPGVGGRWYGIDEDGTQTQWGDVVVWEPPHRLLLAWRIGTDWQYHPDLYTEVDVTFTALDDAATRVELTHRLLENLGDAATAARTTLDSPNGWGAIVALYAQVVASRPS